MILQTVNQPKQQNTNKKPQETVSAEDLELLQNEIETRLVDIVTSRWDLERDLYALNSSSPDHITTATTPSIADSQATLTDGNSQITPCGSAPGTISATNSTEDSLGSDGSQPDFASVSAGVKRSLKAATSNERPSKRFRLNSSTPSSVGPQFPKRPSQSKYRQRFRNSIDESRVKNKKQIVRNEAPDKLWPFVEQFCATPTEEQMQTLEEMIKFMDNDKDYYKVPQQSNSKKNSPTKSDNSDSKNNTNNNTNNPKGLGALTQRVVSIHLGLEPDEDKTTTTNETKKRKNSKPKGGKSIDLNSAKKLEKSIRQGLEECEFLDNKDDIPYNSEDDEILRELKANQHELLTIQRQNKDYMLKLLKKAKKHIELEGEREKLRQANSDVISAYQKLVQAKQRKRNPTKKEKDAAIKALSEQDAMFKKCDELYLSSLNRNV